MQKSKIKSEDLQKYIKTAKQVVDVGKQIVDIGKDAIPMIKPAVQKYAPKVADQVKSGADQVATKGKEAKNVITGGFQQRKKSKEEQKALDEARKRAVLKALPPMTAKEFFKNFENGISDVEELRSGFMCIPGCYAILTLKSSREKDLSAYKDVYVGCGDAIGSAVYFHLRGFGNVDVYADFKADKPMTILFYPCEMDELGKYYADLTECFQAFESYNQWDLLALDAEEE